jgi:hypothetical protein
MEETMIRFSIAVTNPWAKDNVQSKDFVYWDKLFAKHWAAETFSTIYGPK